MTRQWLAHRRCCGNAVLETGRQWTVGQLKCLTMNTAERHDAKLEHDLFWHVKPMYRNSKWRSCNKPWSNLLLLVTAWAAAFNQTFHCYEELWYTSTLDVWAIVTSCTMRRGWEPAQTALQSPLSGSQSASYILLYESLWLSYTPCLKKSKQNYFCYNYVKLPLNLTIFGTKMANCLKLYEVHSFSTSPNLCQCTTVLNADVPNCYITL